MKQQMKDQQAKGEFDVERSVEPPCDMGDAVTAGHYRFDKRFHGALLIVAHDAVNRVLLCRLLGLPLQRLWSFRQAPTTLNLLEGPDVDHLEVVRLNDCTHHTPLFGEAVHRAL